MRIKRFEIDPYDSGPYFEDQMNKFIDGATHIHTMQAPYNDRKPILIYAFYPDEDKARTIQPLEEHFKIGDEVEFNQGNLLLSGSIIGFVVKGDSTYTTNHVWHPKKRRPMTSDQVKNLVNSSYGLTHKEMGTLSESTLLDLLKNRGYPTEFIE